MFDYISKDLEGKLTEQESQEFKELREEHQSVFFDYAIMYADRPGGYEPSTRTRLLIYAGVVGVYILVHFLGKLKK